MSKYLNVKYRLITTGDELDEDELNVVHGCWVSYNGHHPIDGTAKFAAVLDAYGKQASVLNRGYKLNLTVPTTLTDETISAVVESFGMRVTARAMTGDNGLSLRLVRRLTTPHHVLRSSFYDVLTEFCLCIEEFHGCSIDFSHRQIND